MREPAASLRAWPAPHPSRPRRPWPRVILSVPREFPGLGGHGSIGNRKSHLTSADVLIIGTLTRAEGERSVKPSARLSLRWFEPNTCHAISAGQSRCHRMVAPAFACRCERFADRWRRFLGQPWAGSGTPLLFAYRSNIAFEQGKLLPPGFLCPFGVGVLCGPSAGRAGKSRTYSGRRPCPSRGRCNRSLSTDLHGPEPTFVGLRPTRSEKDVHPAATGKSRSVAMRWVRFGDVAKV